MMAEGLPGRHADAESFVLLEKLTAESKQLGQAAFLERYPSPVLLVLPPEDDALLTDPEPVDDKVQLLTLSLNCSAGLLRYLNKVAFIRKRPGNAFAHLISVGRSATNDIPLELDTISRVHGYFIRGDDAWSFTDHGSTNGTKLNEQRLEKGTGHTLADGDVLQLGVEARLLFLTPTSLYERLQKGPSLSGLGRAEPG